PGGHARRTARDQLRPAHGHPRRVPACARRDRGHARRRPAEPAGGGRQAARQDGRRLRLRRQLPQRAARQPVPPRRFARDESDARTHDAHPHDRPGLHAARLRAQRGRRDQPVARIEHLRTGARLYLCAQSDRDRGEARRAHRRRFAVLAVQADQAQLRSDDRVLGEAAADVLRHRHDRRAGLGGAVHRGAVVPVLHRGAGGRARARLGPRRARVLPDRRRGVRHRPDGRVHRPHLRAGARPAALPGAGGARGRSRRQAVEAQAAVFAYHDVGVRCLRVLLEAGVRVPLVVTHRDDPAERVFFGSVAELARSRNLELLVDPPIEHLTGRLGSPDFIFSFYYRRMLPPELLAAARRGAFNMHGSLLPKYRGRAPVNWAVLKGETETGATLHEMVAKPDAGRIVDQEPVPIGEDETAVEVFRNVTAAAETVLRRALPRLIAGTAVLKPQDLARGSYFGARKPGDGRIDWHKSAREIHNLVRAVAPPYPGAFTDTLRIHRTRMEPQLRAPHDSLQGQLGPYRQHGAWYAACGDGGVLRLLEVEPCE